MSALPLLRRASRRAVVLAAVLALAAAPLAAQGPAALTVTPTAAPSAPVATPVAPAPTPDALRAGVHTDTVASVAAIDAAAVQETESGLRHSTILMIVGATAIAIGAFTDGGASDALILGGAVVGLTGLYFRLR